MTAPTAELSTLVRNELRSILAEPAIRNSLLGANSFTLDDRDRLDSIEGQVGTMIRDGSLGRVLSGPTWMDGVSVINGTITADKLQVNTLEAVTASTGTLNVTGSLTLAASFPAVAARIVENSTGILGYNSGSTNTFALNVDGSGSIGVGGTAMSWTTAGVVTIPVAAIGSLTIASVGSGTMGGTYQSGATNQHMKLSTAGISAWTDTAETNRTFFLNAATGAITIAGSFTVQSAASGAHITIDNAGGIAGYNATSEVAGNRTFLVNAATGAGNLGLASIGITWDGSGNVSIPGSLLVGTINASNVTVTNLSFANIQQTGTLGAAQNFGSASMQINGSGKLLFGTGGADYLSNNILHFDISSGTEDAKVEFQNGSNTPTAKLSSLMTSTRALISVNAVQNAANIRGWMKVDTISSGTEIHLHSSKDESSDIADFYLESGGAAPYARIDIGGNPAFLVESTNRRTRLYGYLYPGTGSAAQSTRYISDDGSNMTVNGGSLLLSSALYLGGDTGCSLQTLSNDMKFVMRDTAGTGQVMFLKSSGTQVFGINSLGDFVRPITNDSTALGAYYGRVPIYINGSLKYLGAYS